MAFFDSGNRPINSTGFAVVGAGSTTTLYAELDSTQLGTKDSVAGQKLIAEVRWIVGADTNVTWQLETATSTALGAGADVIFLKTVTAQSGQFVTKHELLKDYRIRARQASTAANGAAFISAEIQT